jgi:hypothetical protein
MKASGVGAGQEGIVGSPDGQLHIGITPASWLKAKAKEETLPAA